MSNPKRHPSSRKTLSGNQIREIYHRLREAYRLDDIFIRSQLLADSPLQPVTGRWPIHSEENKGGLFSGTLCLVHRHVKIGRIVGGILHMNSDKLTTTLNLDILHVVIQSWAAQNQVKTSVVFPRNDLSHVWYEPSILISENEVLENFNAIWKLCVVTYASYQPVLQVIRREVRKARHKLRPH